MDNERCRLLIDLYKENQALWDPKEKNYHNKTIREDSWKEISCIFGMPVGTLKAKMKSLMGTYRREKSRQKQSQITGSGKDSVYVSKWFAFDCFSFLSDGDTPNQTVDTLTEQEPEVSTEDQDEVSDAQISETSTQVVAEEISTPGPSGLQKNKSGSVQVPATPAKRKKRTAVNSISDPMLEQAFTLLQQSANNNDNTDPYFTYGQHIGNELRKYDPRTLACVKQAINNIIFDADMGNLPFPNYGYSHQQYGSPAHTYSSAGTSTQPSITPTPSPASCQPSPHPHSQNVSTDTVDFLKLLE